MEKFPQRRELFFGFVAEEEDGLTKWLKSTLLLSFLLGILVFADYFLPSRENSYAVKKLIVRVGFNDINYELYSKTDNRIGEEEYWIFTDGDDFAVYEKDLKEISIGENIKVFSTFLFGVTKKIESKNQKEIKPYFNLFGWFIFFPIAFILLFGLGFYYKSKTEMVMTLGVINIILLVAFGFLVLFY